MLSVFKLYRFLFGFILSPFVISFLDLKKKKNFVRLSGLTVFFNLLLLLNGSVAAQNTVTGAFQGTVSSTLGGAIAGASVKITNEQTGVSYDLVSDDKGQFFQNLLPPGIYIIRVETANFKARELRRPLYILRTGEVVPVPVTLEPAVSGVATPSAAVIEEADSIRVEINTTDARRDGSFEDEVITKLPLGATTITRSFDELALLLPGVAPPPQTIGDVAGPGVGPGVGSAGQFAVNGLRSRANNFTVDGSDNNDEDIGVRRQGFVALVSQPIESVQEFQIITLLPPAQFGRNIGAQVNIVSKAGGNKFNGTLYGFFNSSQLSARNYFDTTNGTETFALQSATGQSVLRDGQPFTVRNGSGEEDSFTFAQAGSTLGGAMIKGKLFYFASGEYQKINAAQEKNFAVPTVEQRGAFRTGATGIFQNFFDPNTMLQAIPTSLRGAAIFSLFPFPNNPSGVYGENTFTQTLPASGRGAILSGRLDNNFKFADRQQTLTGRYNFTDDDKQIPAVGEAIFSTVLSKIQTHNFSFFLNSQLSDSGSDSQMSNQIRFSIGRTRLKFDEVRDRDFLIPSDNFPDTPFLLNAPYRLNITMPQANGEPNNGNILYFSPFEVPTVESANGAIGQVIVNGFSPLGADVYNFPQTRVNKTYQLADEYTLRFGRHNTVFGADIRRTDLESDLPRLSRPLITFNGTPRLIRRTEAGCPNGGIGNFCFLPASDPTRIIRPEDLVSLGGASNSLLRFNIDRPDARANLRYYQLNFYAQDTWRVAPELSLSYGLRYEYNTPVKEVDNLIEQTFTDSRLLFAPGLSRFIDGRTRLYEPDYNNFAPRVGIAYSPTLFGNNCVSVFRVGYGIFYDQILGAVVNQSSNVFPTFLTLNLGGAELTPQQIQVPLEIYNPARYSVGNFFLTQNGSLNIFNSQLIGLTNFLNYIASAFPNSFSATLPARNLDMPMAHHYSFVYEQQLNQNLSAVIGYIGTTGGNLLRFTTPNLGAGTTVVPTAFGAFSIGGGINVPQTNGIILNIDRTETSIGAINQFETTARSRYDSLQTGLRGRFAQKFDFNLSYVYSSVKDDVSDVFDLAGAYVLPQNSLTFAGEYAPANFDVRHRFTYNAIYNFAKSEKNDFLSRLTDDLQIAATGRIRTGQPFTVNSIVDVNLDGNLTDRLNTTDGIEITGDCSQPLRLTANNPFSLLAPFGEDGQVKRNCFRAGNVVELDLSINKSFFFNKNRLLFRADLFNFINRANFGVPVRLLEAPGFGRATNTVTPNRRVQFSLKYEF